MTTALALVGVGLSRRVNPFLALAVYNSTVKRLNKPKDTACAAKQ